jgi:hypothetical protein
MSFLIFPKSAIDLQTTACPPINRSMHSDEYHPAKDVAGKHPPVGPLDATPVAQPESWSEAIVLIA